MNTNNIKIQTRFDNHDQATTMHPRLQNPVTGGIKLKGTSIVCKELMGEVLGDEMWKLEGT